MSLRIAALAGELVAKGPPRLGGRADGIPPGGLYDPETASLLQAWWGVDGAALELRGGQVVFEAADEITVGWAGAGAGHARLAPGGRLALAPRKPGGTLTIVSSAPWNVEPGHRFAVGERVKGGGYQPPRDGQPEVPGPPSALRFLPFEDRGLEGEWRLTIRADRMGLLWDGAGQMLPSLRRSVPVGVGTIQQPSAHQIIIVGPDGPTVGGYPIVGAVIRADRAALARFAPGDSIRFVPVGLDEADQAWQEAQETHCMRLRRIRTMRKALG
jgi:5-oxoprolinase (ATP-hydrolysing) subunit C